jgi:predicted nucleotidyltransferase
MKKEDIRKKLEKIAKSHDLLLVILFGSQATGKASEKSDVDIAVLGKKIISTEEIIELNNKFADAFEVKEIDVKSLHNTNPLFRWQVAGKGKLLFGKLKDFNSFRAYAFRSYIDSQDLLRLKEIIINKRLKAIAT